MRASSTLLASAFALLLGFDSWQAAAPPPAEVLPPVGTDAGDGYKVAAHWHVTYVYHSHHWAPTLQRRTGQQIHGGPPHWYASLTSETDILEERDKYNNVRSSVRGGHWTYSITGLEYFSSEGQHVPLGDPPPLSGGFPSSHAGLSISYGVTQADGDHVGFDFNPLQAAISPGKGEAPHLDFNYAGLQNAPDLVGFALKGVNHETAPLPFDRFVFTIPATDGAIMRHQRISLDQGSVNITVSRTPLNRGPRPVVVEIQPKLSFWKDWVPTVPGRAGFVARVVDPPGLAVQWRLSLLETSKLPGVCTNANFADLPPSHPGGLSTEWHQQIPENSFDLIFDFRKYGQGPGGLKPIEKPWQHLETTEPSNSIDFEVECLDFGAYGKIAAIAIVDGAYNFAVWPETGESFIRIPWVPRELPGHQMAAAAKTYAGERKYYGRYPEDDRDDAPAGRQQCVGDGFSVFQEYRGFLVRGGDGAQSFKADAPIEHRRLDPDKKDLFVFMPRGTARLLAPYLRDFQAASGLSVQRAGNNDLTRFVDGTLIANLNHEPQASPQCGVLIMDQRISDEGVLGQTWGIGPPKTVAKVEIDTQKCAALESMQKDLSWTKDLTKMSVVHELGHAVGIEHHGEDDYKASETLDSGETVKRHVAKEGAQHSGNSECAMKYVSADCYQHSFFGTDPNSGLRPYDPTNVETVGLKFCSTKIGTALNDKSRSDWQCGDATRGACLSQIVVNDHCAGRGGGSSLVEAGLSGTMPPGDENERAASEGRIRAGVDLELEINRSAAAGVLPGEAVIFTLNLGGLPTPDGQTLQPESRVTRLGSPSNPWNEQIEWLTVGSDGKLTPWSVKPRPVGKVMRTDSSAPAKRSAELAAQLLLDSDVTYTASFVIEQADSARLVPGKTRVFGAIPPQNSGVPSQVLTNSVVIEIRDPARFSPDQQKQAETLRKLSQARVEFLAERFAGAETLSRAVIAAIPDSLEAHLILARSLEAQGKLQEAHKAYSSALGLGKSPPSGREEPPYEIVAALRRLEKKLGIKPNVARIMVPSGPLANHVLSAETPTGKVAAPLSASTLAKLVFDWKLTPSATNDPLEIHWIAADTGGAAPKDFVISSSKSDSGKTSGTFTLTKPTSGFPPGNYRIEIWQSGKMIHSEVFAVEK